MQNNQFVVGLMDYVETLEIIKEKDRRIAELERRLMKIQEILQKAKQSTKVIHLDWSHVQVMDLSKLNGVLAWWLAK